MSKKPKDIYISEMKRQFSKLNEQLDQIIKSLKQQRNIGLIDLSDEVVTDVIEVLSNELDEILMQEPKYSIIGISLRPVYILAKTLHRS